MSKVGTTWDFTYDENGYRTKRTDGQTTYDYAYTDGLLRYMEINGTPYYFTYAPDGTPMGIVEDDTPYFFELNLQGDIVGITSYTGYRVVEYTYDAWGNLLSCTGTRANTIGKRNPLRYRGYVYDEETGLYYVSSRYYDPEVGRFINADEIDYLGADEGLRIFLYLGSGLSQQVPLCGHKGDACRTGSVQSEGIRSFGYKTRCLCRYLRSVKKYRFNLYTFYIHEPKNPIKQGVQTLPLNNEFRELKKWNPVDTPGSYLF